MEAGDTVVALGICGGALRGGAALRFGFCTVFTFAGKLIRRVESYVVPLPGGD